MKLSALVLLLALLAPASCLANEPCMAAVLVVEDNDNELTEDLGVALYTRFLEAAPYETVVVRRGTEEAESFCLAETIRKLAESHDVVDVFLSVHTTPRDADELARLVPPSARKVRLVYSTACYGASAERKAWEGIGARTVVTHNGLNDPVVAMPYFLSRWIAGDRVGETVAAGYRETDLLHQLALSLAGETIDRDLVSGSLPVLVGDPRLRLRDPKKLSPPNELGYHRDSGSSLGLALRALAGRWEVRGEDVAKALDAFYVPEPFDSLDPQVFKRAYTRHEVDVVNRLTLNPYVPVAPAVRPRQELVLELTETTRVPLGRGFSLVFSPTVVIRPTLFDPASGRIALEVEGVRLVGNMISVRAKGIYLYPQGDGRPRVAISAGLYGVIPLYTTVGVGKKSLVDRLAD